MRQRSQHSVRWGGGGGTYAERDGEDDESLAVVAAPGGRVLQIRVCLHLCRWGQDRASELTSPIVKRDSLLAAQQLLCRFVLVLVVLASLLKRDRRGTSRWWFIKGRTVSSRHMLVHMSL